MWFPVPGGWRHDSRAAAANICRCKVHVCRCKSVCAASNEHPPSTASFLQLKKKIGAVLQRKNKICSNSIKFAGAKSPPEFVKTNIYTSRKLLSTGFDFLAYHGLILWIVTCQKKKRKLRMRTLLYLSTWIQNHGRLFWKGFQKKCTQFWTKNHQTPKSVSKQNQLSTD